MDEQQQKLAVMCEYYKLVFVYGVDPYIAHRAFLMIDEYQQVIKELGCGPDKDEPGHDPEVGYGRATRKKPGYRVFHEGNALHVWPERHSHGL